MDAVNRVTELQHLAPSLSLERLLVIIERVNDLLTKTQD